MIVHADDLERDAVDNFVVVIVVVVVASAAASVAVFVVMMRYSSSYFLGVLVFVFATFYVAL